MKKMFNLLFTITLSLCILGCSGDETENEGGDSKVPINPKSYIQGFFELNDMHITPISGVQVNKEKKTITLETSFDAPKEYTINEGIGIGIAIGSEGIDKGLINWTKGSTYTEYYNELVKKIGDTSFNYKIQEGLSYKSIIAIADTLMSINITCDKAIDNSHPAGSNLNTIFSMYCEDPYAIIKNGYKPLTDAVHYSLDGMNSTFPYSLYGSNLSSVNLLEKPYIGNNLFLILETAPENSGEYVFTVLVTNKSGKMLEKTAKAIKIKGIK